MGHPLILFNLQNKNSKQFQNFKTNFKGRHQNLKKLKINKFYKFCNIIINY